MTCRKQKRVRNRTTLMKAKTITALLLATGFLTTAALAADSSATPPSTTTPSLAPWMAPNSVTFASQLRSISKLDSAAVAQGNTVTRTTPSAYVLNVIGQSADWRTKADPYPLPSDDSAGSSEPAAAVMVSAKPPPGANFYNPFATAYRDPPAFIRLTFSFGQSHGS